MTTTELALATTKPSTVRARPWIPLLAAATAVGVLVLALEFGHGLDATTITGLPDPGFSQIGPCPSGS